MGRPQLFGCSEAAAGRGQRRRPPDSEIFHLGRRVGEDGSADTHRKIDGKRVGEETFFVNYLSGAYGAFPYFVASGHITPGTAAHRLSTGLTTLTSRGKYPDFPLTDCFLKVCTISFEGTNILTHNFLGNRRDISYVGLIMMDFPGDGLISRIISLNHKKLDNSAPQPLWATMFIALSITLFGVVLCFSLIRMFKLWRRSSRAVVPSPSQGFEPHQKVPYSRF